MEITSLELRNLCVVLEPFFSRRGYEMRIALLELGEAPMYTPHEDSLSFEAVSLAYPMLALFEQRARIAPSSWLLS